MSEHVMVKDEKRHKIVCAYCGLPWPCEPKQREILDDIKKRQQEALKKP